MKKVCVFAGSNLGLKPEYEQAAIQLGKLIVKNGIELIYGGSSIGLMGRLADTVIAEGGKVIGVMPKNLFFSEKVHRHITELHEVENMHERKALMSNLADSYIALPGGLGTYEELFEVLSWAQIGIHDKPIGVLNVLGYYQPIVDMLNNTAEAGFMKKTNLNLLLIEEEPEALLTRMENYTPITQEDKHS